MHNAMVYRTRNQAHKYEIRCDVCGLVGKQRTNKKLAFEKAAKHNADGKIRMRGAKAQAQVRIERPIVDVDAEGFPTTKAGWVAYVMTHGLIRLGKGASRTAYALNDTQVLKITHSMFQHPRLNDGQPVDQCDYEAARWNSADANLKQHLAAVIKHGAGWVVMERAQMVLDKLDVQTSTMVQMDMRRTTGLNDLHGGNIGYFGGGKFKIIDYGL